MNKNNTPQKRARVPALLSTLLCMVIAGGLHAQSVGDFTIPKKEFATGPLTLKAWAGANSVLWGTDGSGEPGNVTLSGDFSIVAGELQWTGGESADVTGLDLLGAATASAARTILGLGEAALASSTNTEGVAGPGLVLSRAEHTHNLGSSYITGTLPISKGGTGITNTPTNGQLLIGSTTGNQWVRTTLTQGTGITVTNGTGSITVAVNEAGLTLNNIGGTLGASKGGTGITSLSSGMATFLGAASSANLRGTLTDETGTGSAVFAGSPSLTGAVGIAQGSITAPAAVLNLTTTWNDAADVMRGIEFDVTDTASSGDSTLMRMLVGGAPRLSLKKDGTLTVSALTVTGNANFEVFSSYPHFSINWPNAGTMTVSDVWHFIWSFNGSYFDGGDTGLKRGSAGVVKVTNGSTGYGALDTNKVVLNGGVQVTSGSGTPEGVVTAPVGSLFLRTDGSTSTTLYVKTSGTGNTGWTAK